MQMLSKLIHFTLILNLLFISYTQASECPAVFPKSRQISEADMQRILKDAKQNPEIQVQRFNFSGNTNLSIPDSSEGAVVVFAIIGVIVVIAWIPYALMYLYDLQKDRATYCPWYHTSVRYKEIKSSGPELNVKREASFTSINVGIASLKDEYSFFGLGLELGHHEIKDSLDSGSEVYSGEYFMLGPRVSLGKPFRDNITLSLLGGSSTHSNISFMAETNLGWSINLNRAAKKYAPTINLNLGANYLDIKETEGIIKNINKYALYVGMGFGFNY